jgi:hypothetical protein
MRNVWGMFGGRQTFVFCCAEGLTDCRLDCRLNLEHDRSDDYAPCGNTRTGAGAPWRAQSVYEVRCAPAGGADESRPLGFGGTALRPSALRALCLSGTVPMQDILGDKYGTAIPHVYYHVLQAAIRSIGDADVGQISEIRVQCDEVRHARTT